jgi:hypothetical protein
MIDRWHSFVLRLDALFARYYGWGLMALGALVQYAATDTTWAAYLGKWGGIATFAIGFAAQQIAKARRADDMNVKAGGSI